MNDATSDHREQLLSEALLRVLVKAGMVRADAAMTGPELLLAAEDFCTNANAMQGPIQRLLNSARHFAESSDGDFAICRVPKRTVKELCDLVERYGPTLDDPVEEDRYVLMGQTSIGGAMFSLWDREAKKDVVRSIPDGIAQKIVNALNRKPESSLADRDRQVTHDTNLRRTQDGATRVSNRPSTRFAEATCKGSLALGTACGHCSKCVEERGIITAPSPILAEIEFKPVEEVDPRHDHRWIGE